MSKRPPHSGTSWEKVHDWYDDIVGVEGHYYHQNVIMPRLMPWLEKATKILDIGCGQGILARYLPKNALYVGIDSSPSLLAKARKLSANRKHTFRVQDATQPFSLEHKDFSHAVLLLALQNMATLLPVFQNAARHMQLGGKLLLVLNHPCYRIPRQSSWVHDEKKHLQARRVDRYLTPLEIPIFTRPGQKENSTTSLTYHQPLSAYSKALYQAGFCIEILDELCSDKKSYGKNARQENFARKEFPLFLLVVATKVDESERALLSSPQKTS